MIRSANRRNKIVITYLILLILLVVCIFLPATVKSEYNWATNKIYNTRYISGISNPFSWMNLIAINIVFFLSYIGNTLARKIFVLLMIPIYGFLFFVASILMILDFSARVDLGIGWILNIFISAAIIVITLIHTWRKSDKKPKAVDLLDDF